MTPAGAPDRPRRPRQAGKSSAQRLADRICGVFVAAVLAAAALTLAGWLLAGASASAASARSRRAHHRLPVRAGAATPAALIVACGRGAQLGIFIKGYQALEASRSVDTCCWTRPDHHHRGHDRHRAAARARDQPEELLRYLGAVEDGSGHPIAAAVGSLARAELGSSPLADSFQSLPGLGVCGTVDGTAVTAGGKSSPHPGSSSASRWRTSARSWAQAGRPSCWPAGRPRPRRRRGRRHDQAVGRRGVDALRRGLRTVLLTGDSQAVARTIAAKRVDEVIAGALPATRPPSSPPASARPAGRDGRDGVNDAPRCRRRTSAWPSGRAPTWRSTPQT